MQCKAAGSCGCAHCMHTALFICSSFGLKNALQPSAAGPFSFRGTVPCGSQNRKIFFAGRCPAPRRSPRRLRGALPRTLPGLAPWTLFTKKYSQIWQLLGARPHLRSQQLRRSPGMLCPPGARGTGLPLLELASLRLKPLKILLKTAYRVRLLVRLIAAKPTSRKTTKISDSTHWGSSNGP